MKKLLMAMLATSATAVPAAAQFELIEPTVASQQVTMELQNTVNVGGVALGDDVSEHSIGLNYGAFENLEMGLALKFRSVRGTGVDMQGIEWQNTLALLGGEGAGGLALAIYSAVGFDTDDSDDLTWVLGPAFGYDAGALELVGNTFFQLPVDDGGKTGFEYAGSVMYDVSSGVALGVQAYGEVPSFLNETPAVKRQEHFAGPAVSFGFEPEPNREVDVNLGAFVGLTPATPAVGLSANVELGF